MLFIFHAWNLVAAGLIIAYLHSRLRYLWDKQAKGTLLVFFIGGCASVTFIYNIIDAIYPLNYFFPFFHSNDYLFHIFITGITEESSKFLVFIILARSLKSIKEPQDGVIQGAMVGLAFGIIENGMYFSIYPDDWFMLVRPILCTGGHAIYGGIWGGMYSAAVYSNLHSKDNRSYKLALLGLLAAAVTHGIYNAAPGLLIPVLIKVVALYGVNKLFLRLVDHSPYKKYLLSDADKAIPNIRRGLYFNPTSSILNRGLGHFLMYKGQYKQAMKYLRKSIPSAYDSRKAKFFIAVCGIAKYPEYHAQKGIRVAWGRLDDNQRIDYIKHLEAIMQNDSEMIKKLNAILDNAFKLRDWTHPHKLADELRLRKAKRKMRTSANLTFNNLASQLSTEERVRMAARLKSS